MSSWLRTLLVASSVALVVGGLVWSGRLMIQAPRVVENVQPVEPVRRVVQTVMEAPTCPRPGMVEQRVEEVQREVGRLVALEAALEYRMTQVGAPLPDDVSTRWAPERMRAEMEALLEDAPDVRWACDAFPCSAVALFDPEDREAAAALAREVSERFPGETTGVVARDADGYATDSEGAALSVFLHGLDPGREQRIDRQWFHQRLASERLLRSIRAEPLARTPGNQE